MHYQPPFDQVAGARASRFSGKRPFNIKRQDVETGVWAKKQSML